MVRAPSVSDCDFRYRLSTSVRVSCMCATCPPPIRPSFPLFPARVLRLDNLIFYCCRVIDRRCRCTQVVFYVLLQICILFYTLLFNIDYVHDADRMRLVNVSSPTTWDWWVGTTTDIIIVFLIGRQGSSRLFHRGCGVTSWSVSVDGDEKTFSIMIPTHNNIIMTAGRTRYPFLSSIFFPTEFRRKCLFFFKFNL